MSLLSKTIALGSSSPRRRELLSLLFPQQKILVAPPEDDREEELAGELSREQLQQKLLNIAARKAEIVRAQLNRVQEHFDFLLTADTTVAVPGDEGLFLTLGKPCPEQFPEEVAGWFNRYYSGRSHLVLTAVLLETARGQRSSHVVTTEVRFSSLSDEQISWYLGTAESLGKAGGYAIQGLGSLFVEQISGSLSNVIGLPLRETRELFLEFGCSTTA